MFNLHTLEECVQYRVLVYPISKNNCFLISIIIVGVQTQVEMGNDSCVGGCNGHRVRLRRRDGVRLSDAVGHRHPAPQDDYDLVPESHDRLLPDSSARLLQ